MSKTYYPCEGIFPKFEAAKMKTLKRTTEPRFYYHITNEHWKKKKRLFPRKDGDQRGYGEPKVRRICVAPDIIRCFLAIPYSNNGFISYNIYRTYRKTYAYYPYEVVDSIVTREKWLIDPTTFVRIGEIPEYIMEDFPRDKTEHIKKQRKNLVIIRKKLAKLIRDKELEIPEYCF